MFYKKQKAFLAFQQSTEVDKKSPQKLIIRFGYFGSQLFKNEDIRPISTSETVRMQLKSFRSVLSDSAEKGNDCE
jgi:hypothetical protein